MHYIRKFKSPVPQCCGECSLCERELFRGEEIWRMNGLSVCEDCFLPFARAELAPFALTLGEEDEP